MSASRVAALSLAVLAPVVLLAQTGAPDQARQAGADLQTSTEARQRAADERVEKVEQQSVDLGRAASRLEGEPEPQLGDPAKEGAAAENGAAAAAEAEPATGGPPPDVYTVKAGDTLWDLSSRFMSDPWYWPKLWSYNPEITNPHFIYPGSSIRFAGESSGRVEPAPADGDVQGPRDLDDLSRANMKAPQEYGEDDDVAVVGPYKIGYVKPKGLQVRHDTFVTPSELAESGVISAAFEEKRLLTLHDRAYVRFAEPDKVKVGETYALYRTERLVKHPISNAVFGYQSIIIGAGKVIAIDKKVATIKISEAYDPIERGNLVAPWSQKIVTQVEVRPNRRDLEGHVLATEQRLVSEIGEHHVVFVDKGRADGVEEGNVFSVYRSGDPYDLAPNEIHHDPNLPREELGRLLVVDVQERASAAVVVRSIRELYVGDRAVMKSASAPVSVAAPK